MKALNFHPARTADPVDFCNWRRTAAATYFGQHQECTGPHLGLSYIKAFFTLDMLGYETVFH